MHAAPAEPACALGLFLLAATTLATPWDVLPGALLLLVAGALGWRAVRATPVPVALRTVQVAMLAVVAVVVFSKLLADVPWREVDNRARLLLMPVAALVVLALRPPRLLLWWGAVTGVAIAALLAAAEAWAGGVRADGVVSHPLVFSSVVVALVALAVFCRPAAGGGGVATTAGVLGVIALGLSGSRGAWLGVGVIVTAGLLTHGGRMRLLSWGVLAALCVTLLAAWSAPPLARQTRLQELRQDIARLQAGDTDSSLGARLEMYRFAAHAFAAHPLIGVGVGRLGEHVAATPECVERPRAACRLGHAHNDALEWGATMGLPGLFALLAIYGVPLMVFLRLLRALPKAARPCSAALAGAVVVMVFVACGLTQSMFAHQLTATFYALVVGVLLALAAAESAFATPESRLRAPAPERRTQHP
ncbi:MAG TPA: O-antigen ligase family protein [Lysobacter sp.]|nr:O-antigen ligase family protein [Lysobacter sp.]